MRVRDEQTDIVEHYSKDSDGKMTVRVTKARIIIDDPESDQLYVTYEY